MEGEHKRAYRAATSLPSSSTCEARTELQHGESSGQAQRSSRRCQLPQDLHCGCSWFMDGSHRWRGRRVAHGRGCCGRAPHRHLRGTPATAARGTGSGALLRRFHPASCTGRVRTCRDAGAQELQAHVAPELSWGETTQSLLSGFQCKPRTMPGSRVTTSRRTVRLAGARRCVVRSLLFFLVRLGPRCAALHGNDPDDKRLR